AAGTLYAYTLRLTTNRTAGAYQASFSTTPAAYPDGNRVSSANSGATWVIPNTVGTARDLTFKTFMNTGFTTPGTFISSVKEANPLVGATPTWGSIAWTASVPDGTTLLFHAAASDSPFGPFTFVGPDGTDTTSFANGGSLAQFNGKRY